MSVQNHDPREGQPIDGKPGGAHGKVGFVSLGCPKNTVDSERILTQLRAEGYDIVPSYNDADVVIVNTCGFIDSAVQESLDTIGEALAENGKVLVTGCLGAKEDDIREVHPNVLSVTGPHAMSRWSARCTKSHRRSTIRLSRWCRIPALS